MDTLFGRIQESWDDSFAKITGVKSSLLDHRNKNVCTEAFLRLPCRLGGIGIPEVKSLAPVAYLSTLRATSRVIMDSLPDSRKAQLQVTPKEDVTWALEKVKVMSAATGSPTLSDMLPRDSRELRHSA